MKSYPGLKGFPNCQVEKLAGCPRGNSLLHNLLPFKSHINIYGTTRQRIITRITAFFSKGGRKNKKGTVNSMFCWRKKWEVFIFFVKNEANAYLKSLFFIYWYRRGRAGSGYKSLRKPSFSSTVHRNPLKKVLFHSPGAILTVHNKNKYLFFNIYIFFLLTADFFILFFIFS